MSPAYPSPLLSPIEKSKPYAVIFATAFSYPVSSLEIQSLRLDFST